ncbi:hypothetical protein MA20_48650 [Bradyrhizobium japonicum]|uniref:Uncharacterized protein n=1 Tax=Bradyrhizobium japonicum TaxID=375 RepID=A0A0A3XHR0_BRAJP|nr:hypothetical protein MA20_48650 [Bradyrhizobium japonicum]
MLQVWKVLEEVGIQLFFIYLYIWLYIIGKFLDFQVNALLFQFRLNELEDFRLRHRSCPDFQGNLFLLAASSSCRRRRRFFFLAAACRQREGKR